LGLVHRYAEPLLRDAEFRIGLAYRVMDVRMMDNLNSYPPHLKHVHHADEAVCETVRKLRQEGRRVSKQTTITTEVRISSMPAKRVATYIGMRQTMGSGRERGDYRGVTMSE